MAHSDGELRCFLCESKARYPGRDIDPDAVNSELREAHRRLWSKPLPRGTDLILSADTWANYLTVISSSERWTLGSDNFATCHTNSLRSFAQRLDDFADGHL